MYSLSIWQKPDSDETRIYLKGTTREAVYLKLASTGRIVWSSKTKDTPAKFRKGDHYGKIGKDGDAAHAVAAAFKIPLGDDSTADDWERALGLARDGIQVREE